MRQSRERFCLGRRRRQLETKVQIIKVNPRLSLMFAFGSTREDIRSHSTLPRAVAYQRAHLSGRGAAPGQTTLLTRSSVNRDGGTKRGPPFWSTDDLPLPPSLSPKRRLTM